MQAIEVALSVSVLITTMFLQNGWTNWDAMWGVDSHGPKELCIRWGYIWNQLVYMTEQTVLG